MLRFSSLKANGRISFHPRNNRTASSQNLKKTVLYDFHKEHEGKMVPYAGWSMPVQYKGLGIIDSHKHTRSKASLFDVSHMLQTRIYGKHREDFIESLVVGNIKELKPNRGGLSVFTNDRGGIMDDVIINKTNNDYLYVVSNAGCADKILDHFQAASQSFKSSGKDVAVEPLNNGLIALQGPKAGSVLQAGVKIDLSKLYFMESVECSIHGIDGCRITRCGYTGEDGFEISIRPHETTGLANRFVEHDDVELAGLGARDSLRLEAGLCLYGNDIDEDITPVQAALTWCIGKRRRGERNFPGAEIILNEIKNKPIRRRVGLITDGIVARAGVDVLSSDSKTIGKVTSGCPAPSLEKNIAMAYVPNSLSKAGNKLKVLVRKKTYDCTVTKMPFVPSKYYMRS